MVRIAVLMMMCPIVCFSPNGLAASEESFKQELRACYAEALNAVLISNKGLEKVNTCIELTEGRIEALEKANLEVLSSVIEEGFDTEQKKRIQTVLNTELILKSVDDLFSPQFSEEVGGIGQEGGDELLSLGIRLYGVWPLGADQNCKRDGQCLPCGQMAREFLDDAISGKKVSCRISTGSSGVGSGLCRVEGEDIGLLLVQNGWAEINEKDEVQDPKSVKTYRLAYETAKEKKLGIHGWEYLTFYERYGGTRLECRD